jgi:hypothetical protein
VTAAPRPVPVGYRFRDVDPHRSLPGRDRVPLVERPCPVGYRPRGSVRACTEGGNPACPAVCRTTHRTQCSRRRRGAHATAVSISSGLAERHGPAPTRASLGPPIRREAGGCTTYDTRRDAWVVGDEPCASSTSPGWTMRREQPRAGSAGIGRESSRSAPTSRSPASRPACARRTPARPRAGCARSRG